MTIVDPPPHAGTADCRDRATLPLDGMSFAAKDTIDTADIATS
ncbi:hypothetical protein CZ771_11675 [Actinomycetales bacterium JB111]|nr:hypothetical protein CZ771_11675 [Actinomycetales bacterium JB111]